MFKEISKIILFLTLASLFFPKKSFAYLDPGSGSYLIQIIVASLAGLGYLIKTNWEKIKGLLLKKNKKGAKGEPKNKSS